MRSFLTPWPWLVIGLAVLALTLAALAFAQGDCSEGVTHEERVECYMAASAAADSESAAADSVLAQGGPAALVMGSALLALMLVKAPRVAR